MKTAPLSLNESYEGIVENLAFGGEGIVRYQNFVTFIPFTVPGDKLIFKVSEIKKSFARATITKLLEPSPHRVKASCPIYFECGGCQLQEYQYQVSVQEKSRILESMLQHGLGIPQIPMVSPLESKKPYGYRHKMQLAVGKSSHHKYLLGLYEPRSHHIVDMPSCPIQDEINNQLLQAFRNGLEAVEWGMIRHLLARSNQKGEAYVVIVTAQNELPQWERFLEIVRLKVPSLKGLALNINPNHTNVILGPETKVLWGDPFFEETIGEMRYRIGPTSFFQVNVGILEATIKHILLWSKATYKSSILDLYCGVGTFSIPLAKTGAFVVGIEEHTESIDWAKQNATFNDVPKIQFYSGKVETILPSLNEKVDITLVDPPRKGLSHSVIAQLIQLAPKTLLYLSCNPATLTRDVKAFIDSGWKLTRVCALDFFPQTAHIEALALLER